VDEVRDNYRFIAWQDAHVYLAIGCGASIFGLFGPVAKRPDMCSS